MAANVQKIMYLKIGENQNIRAYVIDYITDFIAKKDYVVIAADEKGSNAKVYEIQDDQALVLSKEEVMQFADYRNNPRFVSANQKYEDGLSFVLTKERVPKKIDREEPTERKSASELSEENQEVIYYVFDYDTLRSYSATSKMVDPNSLIFDNVHAIQTWSQISLEQAEEIVKSETQSLGKLTYFIENKMKDLSFENGKMKALNFKKIKPISKETKKEKDTSHEHTTDKIVYYVYDLGLLRSYQANAVKNADGTYQLSDVKVLQTWKNVEDPSSVITEQKHTSVVYFIKNKMEDMTIEKNGTIIAKNMLEIKPLQLKRKISTQNEDKKRDTVFYLYNGETVKKYCGKKLDSKDSTKIIFSNCKLLETITGAAKLNVSQFLAGETVELGAYFANQKDAEIQGTKIVLSNALKKDKQTILETPKKSIAPQKEKVIVANGDIDVYGGRTHYTIFASVCTIISKEPLTLSSDSNGIKTITFEKEGANSIQETCQAYQNLYPNVPIYLLKGVEITDWKNFSLETNQYEKFAPKNEKSESLLEQGKKVLTEDEMIEARKKELEEMRNKKVSFQSFYKTPIFDAYIASHPDDISFGNYIRSLELAGVTKEHMIATGLFSEIEKKMGIKSSLPEQKKPIPPIEPESSLVSPIKITLSQSFRKHFPVVKGVNDDILKAIEKKEKFGETPEQIIEELNLPNAMVEQFQQDIPSLKKSLKLEEPKKATLH